MRRSNEPFHAAEQPAVVLEVSRGPAVVLEASREPAVVLEASRGPEAAEVSRWVRAVEQEHGVRA